jgi:DNA modification methylase
MTEATVDLVLTDPPFAVGIKYGEHYDDNMSLEQYVEWCRSWIKEVYRVLKPNGSACIFSSPKHIREFLNLLHDQGFIYKDIIIWNKINAHMPISRSPLAKFEPCYWVVKGKDYTFNNNGLQNVETFCVLQPRNPEWIEGNPAQRPVALYERIVKTFSNPGDLVLDPFVGSGTTLLACKRTGRNGIGFDLNPKMEVVIRKRVFMDYPDITDAFTHAVESYGDKDAKAEAHEEEQEARGMGGHDPGHGKEVPGEAPLSARRDSRAEKGLDNWM